MTNKLNPFINEDKQQEILKGLIEVKNQYELLKVEFNKPHDKEILEMIVGNKPIIQYLQSNKCKKKENGELLLGNTDWSAIIDALRKSVPQQEIPKEKVLKTNVPTLSADKSEEQKIIPQLEKIAKFLSEIEDTYIVLANSSLQEREQLYKIIEQLNNKKQ